MDKSIQFLMMTAGLGLGIGNAGTAQAESWQGPHIGVIVGVAQNDNVFIDVDGFIGPGPGFDNPGGIAQPGAGARFPYGDSAAVYGVLAGYDWQFGNLVAGVEIDFTLAANASSAPIDLAEFDETAFTNFDHVATLRARAGWATGRLLLFGTAGVALGSFENELFDLDLDENNHYTIYDLDDSFLDKRQDIGLAVGGGAEFRLARHWNIRIEGQFIDFGTSRNIVNLADDAVPPTTGTQNYDVENEMLVIRGGLTYTF
jgi:opacity protein-like surface antigen